MAVFLLFSFDFMLMLLLLLHVQFTNQISFSFPNFTGNSTGAGSCSSGGSYVCLQGNVSVSDAGVIDLTNKTLHSVGRAAYSKPVRIWNNSTGKAASFTTEFSFKIAKIPGQPYTSNVGDGLAFFLSRYPSTIPSDSAGGQLGLITEGGSVGQSFVAVEFDTYFNNWDPPPSTFSAHVGINIDNIKSNTTLNVNFTNEVGRAVIKYDAETLNLSLSVFYQGDPLLNGSTLISSIVNISNNLPEEVAVGFTAATGSNRELHQIISWNFTSSPLEDIYNQTKNNTSEVPTTITDNNRRRSAVVVGTTVGVGLLVITSVCVVLGFLFFRKKSKARRREGESSDDEERQSIDDELEDGRGPNPRRFPYQTLVDATDNFKSEAKIGEGGFGPVYRGFLSDLNLEVAIKRVSSQSKQGKKEYISEIKIISRLRHKNLVQLIGWCHRRSDLLLVYELMPNRSLDFHLFNPKSFLPWTVRYKIALDLASGLLYLHEEWEQCVVHRDIKSSNVMLDSSFNAKLGDFGLARLSQHGTGLQTTFVAGTLGYMAPECIITCKKASKESDVYSFGVVALEIACGRRSIDQTTMDPDKERLVEWVWSMYGKGMLMEAIDGRFDEEGDVVIEDHARRLMVVGLWCAHPDLNHRPSIRQAISVLNLERSMPSLPSDMPSLTYNSLAPFLDEEYLHETSSLNSVPSNSNATDSSSSMPLMFTTSSIKSLR